MGRAVMVGRGPTGAGALLLSILITLTAEGCRAQKGDGCGPSVLGPSSGSLSSLGYPRTYPNDTVCEWEISVPHGKKVHFRIATLDIEDSDCQVNYLRLFNGIGPKRTEIVKYCSLGLSVGGLINSSGHQVTVQFMSGTHQTGRGFYLSYSTSEHTDLITCLDKVTDFKEQEFSKYCPAGCLTSPQEISGTIPNGYRDSSPLCVAAVHAGVVSNAEGGRISVVTSKGIDRYEGTLANNVASTGGTLSDSLFTFKTSGCYGTLGLESGVVADTQLSASSVLEDDQRGQRRVWAPSGARLKREGLAWAPADNDQNPWLQVDLKRVKRITGIITTGSTLSQDKSYISAYKVLYSEEGRTWYTYTEGNSTTEKSFRGNNNFEDEVRNNFIPEINARYVRIKPTKRHSRGALKLELLGCPARARMHNPPPPPPRGTKRPPYLGQSTHTPNVRNTTMPPHTGKDIVLAAVLVPVLAMALTALVLTVVCAWRYRNRKESSEGAYDLPHWDGTDWWKSMKQLLPSKMVESEDSIRYSSSEVDRLTGRGVVPGLHAEPAARGAGPTTLANITAPGEYAQSLVSGVTTLGRRSTFKPDDGPAPELYDAPISPDVYHAYAEPLPSSGSEYATPIVVDMGLNPPSTVCSFKSAGPGSVHTWTDGAHSGKSSYDTPKNASEQVTPTEDLTYQVPQKSAQKSGGQS
ncbi:discoidin, CUB and LCCL domain-containing protein 2 isoform 2-T2 [Pholidichthys leucotaenia]